MKQDFQFNMNRGSVIQSKKGKCWCEYNKLGDWGSCKNEL